jgi:hypothetical protein
MSLLVKIVFIELGVVAHVCNPSPLEAGAGGWRIQGQPGSQKTQLTEQQSPQTK